MLAAGQPDIRFEGLEHGVLVGAERGGRVEVRPLIAQARCG